MVIRHNGIVIDRQAQTIFHNGFTRHFRATKNSAYSKHGNLFFEAVGFMMLNGWTSRDQLFHHLYGGDPDGGPECGVHMLDVRLPQWRASLGRLGLEIVREKRGGVQYFKIAYLKP